jgi:hypothetical protein
MSRHVYLETPDAWRDIPLDRVVKAIKKHYDRPEPLVLPSMPAIA